MKRLIAFCAVLCMTCTCLVGTAFASNVGYPPFPDEDYSEAVVISEFGSLYLFLFSGDVDPYIDSTGSLMIESANIYRYDSSADEWYFSGPGSMISYPLFIEVLYTSCDIYDAAGKLYFEGSGLADSNASQAVLSDSVSSLSLMGVLDEVLGLLVVAIPVVLGLFGIRKGIAFLFARIRGV